MKRSPHELAMIGGTTKCGRVMAQYFGNLEVNIFEQKILVEVGSGSGKKKIRR